MWCRTARSHRYATFWLLDVRNIIDNLKGVCCTRKIDAIKVKSVPPICSNLHHYASFSLASWTCRCLLYENIIPLVACVFSTKFATYEYRSLVMFVAGVSCGIQGQQRQTYPVMLRHGALKVETFDRNERTTGWDDGNTAYTSSACALSIDRPRCLAL